MIGVVLVMEKIEKEGYTRKEVSEKLGISASSIQMYTDKGIITPKVANPSGRGSVRRYSDENLLELLIIKELQKFGIPLKKIDKLIKAKWQMALIWRVYSEKCPLKDQKMYLIIKNSLIAEEFNFSVSIIDGSEEVKFSMERSQSALVVELSAMSCISFDCDLGRKHFKLPEIEIEQIDNENSIHKDRRSIHGIA